MLDFREKGLTVNPFVSRKHAPAADVWMAKEIFLRETEEANILISVRKSGSAFLFTIDLTKCKVHWKEIKNLSGHKWEGWCKIIKYIFGPWKIKHLKFSFMFDWGEFFFFSPLIG